MNLGSNAVKSTSSGEVVLSAPEQGVVEAAVALERVRAAVQSLAVPHAAGGSADGVLTISAGLAACTSTRRVPSTQLLSEADAALYEAKGAGRNRITLAGSVSAQSAAR